MSIPEEPDSLRQRRSGSGPRYEDYGSGTAYAEAVRAWVWAYQSWQMAQAMMPLQVHSALLASAAAAATPPPVAAPAAAAAAAVTAPSRTFHIASFGRRLMAELTDFCFCFLLKLLILYFLVEIHIIDLEKYGKLLSDQADLATFLEVTQDLFPIEIANKFITSMLEALVMWNGWLGIPPGYTPGKFLMGIKVMSCSAVAAHSRRDVRVTLLNPQPLTLSTSLSRSMIKNTCLSFLFPLSIVMYAFKYNRSLYDIATGTIVVESQG